MHLGYNPGGICTPVTYPGGICTPVTYPGGVYSLLLPGWCIQPPATRVVYCTFYIPGWYTAPFTYPGWCIASLPATRVVYSLPSCYPGGIHSSLPGWYTLSSYHGGIHSSLPWWYTPSSRVYLHPTRPPWQSARHRPARPWQCEDSLGSRRE